MVFRFRVHCCQHTLLDFSVRSSPLVERQFAIRNHFSLPQIHSRKSRELMERTPDQVKNYYSPKVQ